MGIYLTTICLLIRPTTCFNLFWGSVVVFENKPEHGLLFRMLIWKGEHMVMSLARSRVALIFISD